MIRILFLALLTAALAACAGGDRLAAVSGACYPLNAGQWSPPPNLPCPPVAPR